MFAARFITLKLQRTFHLFQQEKHQFGGDRRSVDLNAQFRNPSKVPYWTCKSHVYRASAVLLEFVLSRSVGSIFSAPPSRLLRSRVCVFAVFSMTMDFVQVGETFVKFYYEKFATNRSTTIKLNHTLFIITLYIITHNMQYHTLYIIIKYSLY